MLQISSPDAVIVSPSVTESPRQAIRGVRFSSRIFPALSALFVPIPVTASEGYVLLDMYDLENIQAFVIEDGAEHSIRDYTVSIYKDKENGGLSVEVTGHLFEAE